MESTSKLKVNGQEVPTYINKLKSFISNYYANKDEID